jgi:nuclear transport factor 2 (NTF2) superfamily protein
MIADKPWCFFQERAAIVDALIKKWAKELDYRLI